MYLEASPRTINSWMKSCKSPTEKCVASKPGKCIEKNIENCKIVKFTLICTCQRIVSLYTNNDNNANPDTYNTTAPGAGQGMMYYYAGSYMSVEWTAQHGCGKENPHVDCEIILPLPRNDCGVGSSIVESY